MIGIRMLAASIASTNIWPKSLLSSSKMIATTTEASDARAVSASSQRPERVSTIFRASTRPRRAREGRSERSVSAAVLMPPAPLRPT